MNYFSITRELNGHLDVLQNGLVSQSIVSSVKETAIDVKFHDPSNFLKDAVLHYFWFINTVNYGQTQTVRNYIISNMNINIQTNVLFFVGSL